MFICDCCGLCCKNVSVSPLYSDLDRGDGICRNFDCETNLCKIYDFRPERCNVDRMYEVYFSDIMTKEEYYKINYEACNKLKRKG